MAYFKEIEETQNIRPPSGESRPEPLEYEAEVLTTQLPI